jgi:predicted RNA-binding protein with PIN domain
MLSSRNAPVLTVYSAIFGGFVPYLIDGHNLIAAMPGLSLSDLDDEQALIRILAGYARSSRRRITIYFDRGSLAAPQLPNPAGISAHFVRFPRTADDAIRSHIQRLGGEAANWTVVSSDREVRTAARRAGARVIDSAAFASMLSEPPPETGEQEKPEVILEPDEIANWEKLFNRKDRKNKP